MDHRRRVAGGARSSTRTLAGVLSLLLVVAAFPLAAPPAMAASGNLAGSATVTASSQNTASSQTAAKAVDGSPLGYPSDSTKEWATVGGKAGSWLQLTWTAPITTDKVVLYDRPNLDDRITQGSLVFSDGSRVATGPLVNDGTATTVTFPAKTTSSVRLEVVAVATTTYNVGLAEIEVWGANAENRAPVANAGADRIVAVGTAVTLDGSASSDPDGDSLTYSWEPTGSPQGTLSGAGTARPTFTPAQTGDYTFTLTVSDGKLSSTDTVVITAKPNQAPTANAGSGQSVYAGNQVRLDGTKSNDPEGAQLSYAWTQVGSTPAAVTLSGSATAQPTFTPTVVGTYTFQLVVNDGSLASAPAQATVAVTEAPAVPANIAPKATVTASSQNTATGQTAAKAVDLSATGYPGDYTKEWATVGGKSGSWLKLTWSVPMLITSIVLYDRPNTDDAVTGGRLTFSDGSTVQTGALANSGTATTVSFTARTATSVQFDITSVSSTTSNVGLSEIQVMGYQAANRAPIAQATAAANALTGAAVTLNGTGSSDPDGDPLAYQWTQTSPASPQVTISNATSASASFTAATPGTYEFQLLVSDGKLTATATVSVKVDQNLPPVADAGPDQDGLTGRTITLSGSGSDPNGTAVTYAWAQVGTTPAVVTLTNPTTTNPTFTTRTAGKYTFRLTVSDGVTQVSDTVDVTLAQAPNTPPVANAGTAQTVQPGTLVTLDGSKSSDPDGDPLTYSWKLTDGSGVTLANPLTAKPTFTPAANGVFTFTLTVSDGVATSTATVTITVQAAGTLAVANSGTSAVWTADFGSANAGKQVQLQKQTIVTSMTAEVATATWVSLGNATANGSGVASFTISDPLEVTHLYRAAINPTASPLLTNTVSYAAPRATKNTGLATVYIDTNEGASITDTTTYWEGRMTMTAASGAAGTTTVPCAAAANLLMKVSGRGNYTWSLDKKPLKIGLDKKANLCGMGDGKKWALVANHYDRSLLRNTVAMKVGQSLDNLAFTPDSVPVDVYVNGSYQGSYTLMERITIGSNRVTIDELKNNTGGVNDKTPNVTGGYLLEWDFRAKGDHNIVVGGSGTVAIDEPGDELDGSGITKAQIDYISGYVNSADQAMFASNFADPTNGWRKYIDEKSLIDWYIAQELTKNLDSNLYTSCFMYKTRDTVVNGVTVPGKLYFGPIWDFDTSMGDALYPGSQGTTSGWYLRNQNSAIDAKQTSETWINRVFQDPTFAANVKARWRQVYPTLTQTDSYIASQSSLISSSANANFQKWSVTERLEDVQVIKGSWSAEVSSLRSWLSARIAWMNGQLG